MLHHVNGDAVHEYVLHGTASVEHQQRTPQPQHSSVNATGAHCTWNISQLDGQHTERYRETQRATERYRHRRTQRNTERQREIDTERHRCHLIDMVYSLTLDLILIVYFGDKSMAEYKY